MTIITKYVNGYGPYKYRVTYEDGEHVWEYLGPAEGSDSDGGEVVTDDDQEGTVTPEDIEDLSPEEIEELKKEWTEEELEEWKGRRTRFGLVHDKNLSAWKKKGYRLYDDETDAYIDGVTGEIKDDSEGVFSRRTEGDEFVYSKNGEDVGRILQWRAYLGRASPKKEEMLEAVDKSNYEHESHEVKMARNTYKKGDINPVNR